MRAAVLWAFDDLRIQELELEPELGATDTLLSGRDEIPQGLDVAIECLGRPETIEPATRSIAPGGTAVLVGMAHPDALERIEAGDETRSVVVHG